VTTPEGVVETAGLVEIRRMQRQPTSREAGHALQEARLGRIVRIAHACTHAIAVVEQ
jgi:hypothetical protein